MARYRVLQYFILAAATLFLLVLALKFRPRIETPAPVPPPRPKAQGEGTVTAEAFRYVQLTGDRTDFEVTADEVSDSTRGEKLLTRPVVVTPLPGGRSDRASAARGTLDTASRAFRLFEGARLESGGWVCESTGFRFTPEGEAVSEGPVTFSRGDLKGSAELFHYQRARRRATLEGSVRLDGSGGRTLRASKVHIDLEAHGGVLEGPLVFGSEEGTLTAPRGLLVLTEENTFRSADLGEPVRAWGPRGTVDASRLAVEADGSGKPSRYTFSGGVRLHTPAPDPSNLATEALTLRSEGGGGWSWTAPGPMRFTGSGQTVDAGGGSGDFGRGGGPSADLAGPVRGTGERGDALGDAARLRDGVWTLMGHASLCRAGDALAADRVSWRADGSGSAEGSVAGRRTPAGGGEPIDFRARTAEVSPGGYPLRLAGEAFVATGSLALTAPRIVLASAERARAEGGASALFQDPESGPCRLVSRAVEYDGTLSLAWAEGGAEAEGRGYHLSAPRIEAHLDEGRRAERLEATGGVRFEGDLYDGEGDRMVYRPGTRSGEVSRLDRDAVVVQKSPYRRLSAPVVRFAPSRAETLPGEAPSRRGRLEGIAPAPGGNGEGRSPGRGEKRAGGAHG